MTNAKHILGAAAVAAALSSSPVKAEGTPVTPVQDHTNERVEKVLQPQNTIPTGNIVQIGDTTGPQIGIGAVNHGRETGVSGQAIFPVGNNTTIVVGADKSKNETHAIIGAGTSFDNGYVYGTASMAEENHYGTKLRGWGASVGGAYVNPNTDSVFAGMDGNVKVHTAQDKTINEKFDTDVVTNVEVIGNREITTTERTVTKTTTHFDGQYQGEANLGASFNVGQNGELRVGAKHHFGMRDDTTGNLTYKHYFDDNHSAVFVSADTDKRYAAGVIVQPQNSRWSYTLSGTHNNGHNGVMAGVTYKFGGDNQPLRTRDSRNANARMNAEMRAINTSSSHAVKNLDRLGKLEVTQEIVEQSKTVTERILNTEAKFVKPTVTVNEDTITVTHHGIDDKDGIENVEYILTTAGGTTVKNKTGVFSGLVNGVYTISTTAETKNPETNTFEPAINPETTSVTVNVINDTLTTFIEPKYTTDKNTITVTDAGIRDADGVQNIEYILTDSNGNSTKNSTGIFSNLANGTYTLKVSAQVLNAKTNEYKRVFNENESTINIKHFSNIVDYLDNMQYRYEARTAPYTADIDVSEIIRLGGKIEAIELYTTLKDGSILLETPYWQEEINNGNFNNTGKITAGLRNHHPDAGGTYLWFYVIHNDLPGKKEGVSIHIYH